MPKISIVTPSYNHENYIDFFINSVLAQTEQDFELIIVDDYSKDNNVKKIEQYNDPRIKLVKHDFNQGINASISDAVQMSTSDIICLIASDDMLCNNYLEEILTIFTTSSADVVYVSLNCCDINNKSTGMRLVYKNKPANEFLKQSFIAKNQFASPGMAFRKSAIMPHLPLPAGIFVYQDWDMHNKLLMAGCNIFVTDKCLINYRLSSGSASAANEFTRIRNLAETDMLLDHFLTINNIETFKKIFCGVYEQFGEPTVETIPYFLARIALTSSIHAKKMWGYKMLLKYISQGNNFKLLHDKYGIDFADIISQTPLDEEFIKYKQKRKKYKVLYNILLVACLLLMIFNLVLFFKAL